VAAPAQATRVAPGGLEFPWISLGQWWFTLLEEEVDREAVERQAPEAVVTWGGQVLSALQQQEMDYQTQGLVEAAAGFQ